MGNDKARSKAQVENIGYNLYKYAFTPFCTGRLDLFEKLEVFIQVMASKSAHKVTKNAIHKAPKQSR